MASLHPPPLVGAVFERAPTSTPSSPFTPASKTGFPQAPHRSKKSAFARAREAAGSSSGPRDYVPVIVPSKRPVDPPSEEAPEPPPSDERADDWRAQMSRENELRVSAMTDEEREEERREILEKLGPGIGDLLKKVREARATTAPLASALSSSPSSTRPASRASKQLRFAAVTPNDVHVYESAPPSPRKKALALLPPSADDKDAVSLGVLTQHPPQDTLETGGSVPVQDTPQDAPETEPEEGTPEYIRRRFFPSAPTHNPDLAWLEDTVPSGPDAQPPVDALRFDLAGSPLASPLHASLPTHLGLHHHAPDADGLQRAGYTLDDVFLMSRSAVKAQRAAGMRMLGGVARWVGAVHRGDADLVDGAPKVAEIDDVKKRVMAAGIDAMAERGALGVHAVEVVWECVVGWAEGEEALDLDVELDMEGVELGTKDTFPLDHLLPQIVAALSTQAESPDVSASARILAILHRLGRQTNAVATEIVSTPNLISSLFRTFLLTGAANPASLDLLTTLASSTRVNAQALTPPADALLRFVTTLPPPDPALLTGTLNFYKALAAYGLYAHIASIAHLQLAAVAQYLLDENEPDRSLMCAWVGLLEAWIVCATDPHQTTPEHEILWSQVVAWGWNDDILALRSRLGAARADWEVWAALWRAEAAWLEGARVNGVRGGEKERTDCVTAVLTAFEVEDGREHVVVQGALGAFASGLNDFGRGGAVKLRALGRSAEPLMAAMRLWLACLPPVADGPLSAPPFSLPFAQLSDLCAKLVTHSLWARVSKSGAGYVFYRPLARLLSVYLRLSQRLPDVSQDVWMAQALSILSRLLPGDEEFALQITQELLEPVTPQWALARGLHVLQAVWDKGGVRILKPFLVHTVQPRADVHVAPWCLSPQSIKRATTLRLPAPAAAVDSRAFGLPVRRDWTLSPLDHLLRSGTSLVFNKLPPGWDASEVDVTRAALLLTKIAREVAARFSFVDFVLTGEEAVFGCMKVFMLEHGQPQSDSAEEVFRDGLVGRLMDELLAPFTAAAATTSPSSPVIPSPPPQPDLEQVSAGFLGPSTPFYQYYTDLVALYDAISFAHPTFARLLLPPTAMRYAPDYRRLLWNDYGHVLRTVRTEPADVLGDLGGYLWPAEADAQMLGAYLRALVNSKGGGRLQGFPRMVATHHVACSIWPDLRDGVMTEVSEERAEKLLRVVVEQGDVKVVREVVCYRQGREGKVEVPPKCFELNEEIKMARWEFAQRVGGEAFASRVEGLLR
ncbi:hypothetical protein B0H19DRAFT_1369701 [Mycena capillaripes]|nr:hypothetical protein B0H19DRAFT_1369701 [Mycena capillaripes]